MVNDMKKSIRNLGLLCGLGMMLISAEPVLAVPETVTVPGIEGDSVYFDAETGVIRGFGENVTVANIPNEINGVTVTGIYKYAFEYCDELTKVVLPDTIAEIEDYQFYGCEKLTTVEIPDSITAIGEQAFYCCTSLEEITLHDGITVIELGAFSYCDSLTEVRLPAGLEELSMELFWCCDSLEKVIIPSEDTAVYYDDNALNIFYACPKLTSVGPLGSGCNIEFAWTEALPDGLFCRCEVIKEVQLPDTLKTIGMHLFYGCKNLETVNIPESVTEIGECAFSGCSSLKEAIIPSGVTQLSEHAFYGCSSLEKVVVPASVTQLSETTFYSNGAFEACTSLTSAGPIGSGCSYEFGWTEKIPEGAFDGCSGLTTVILPEGLKIIGSNAFVGCSNLEKINIPSSVMEVCRKWSEGLYEGCEKLVSAGPLGSGCNIEYGWTLRIPDRAFSACPNLRSVILPEGIVSIGVSAFAECTKLQDIKIPSTVTLIEGMAFQYCESLTEMELPSGVSELGYQAFNGCTGLTSFDIPSKLTEISWSSFEGCSNLEKVTIPYGVKFIGGSAFAECTKLQNIKLPYSLTRIDGNAFKNCDALTDMQIPISVEDLGGAFSDCDNLTSVTIPSNLWYWGEDGYSRCDNLTEVKIASGISYIPEESFYESQKLAAVYIPASVTEVRKSAFQWCSGLKDVYYGGTKEQWEAITVEAGNEELQAAAIHYGSEEIPTLTEFKDAEENQFYYGPMTWAVEKGITTGYTQTTFAPDVQCTRAQIVTFLWRATGKPAPTSRSHNFTDVKEGEYYYEAMLWAVENGITNGYGENTFAPDVVCTRAQCVTFLHRALNKPQPAITEHPFTDVDAKQFYYDAMLWAVGANVTTGYTSTTFAPDTACTRGQIVTFLYRALY